MNTHLSRSRYEYAVVTEPISMVGRPKAWICVRLLGGIAGSNRAGFVDGLF